MAEATRIVNVHRAKVGAHGHVFGFDHHNGRRGVIRQAGTPTQQQVFETALQADIDRGADQRRAAGPVEASSQQRCQARFKARGQQQRLLQRLTDCRLRPNPVLRQPAQHLVPGHLCALRVTVGAQAAWRLRQHGEQGCLGTGELLWRLAQIGPTGCSNTLQGTAKWRAIEVQLKNLRLAQVPFQLSGAP